MNSTDPIAVIGMAGLFPGADNLDSFWQHIIDRVNASREVPPERWGVAPQTMVSADLQPDKAYSVRCCPITHFDFDPHGFDLDPQLLSSLDPLYHIVLHVGREALSAIPAASLNRDIERCVRKLPEQYLWSYKRYRIRPPGSPSPYRKR